MNPARPPNPRYIAILALVACLVLIGGWLARPRSTAQASVPVPTETELEQLARRTERRALDSTATYFAGIARDLEPSVVYIPSAGASGVAWDESRIVTAPFPTAPSGEAVGLAGAAAGVEVRAGLWGPNLPFAVLVMPAAVPGVTAAHPAERNPTAGDWVVAVWQTETASAFAVGRVHQSSNVHCHGEAVLQIASSLSLTHAMTGGGLFDIDGHLLAVMLPCGDGLAAVATASIQSILGRGNTIEQQLQSRYGIVVGTLLADESAYFKTDSGAVVRDVWVDYPADVAGLRPGDLIVASNGTPVATAEDLSRATASSPTPPLFTIRRGARKMTVGLAAPIAPQSQAEPRAAGLLIESPPTTYRIDSVQPGSRAARAGIQPGDRIVRIGEVSPRSADDVARILGGKSQRPVWLEVLRGRRRTGALLR